METTPSWRLSRNGNDVRDMGYVVRYKQGGTPYRTEPYFTYEMAKVKKEVLELLAGDIGLTDIEIVEVYF